MRPSFVVVIMSLMFVFSGTGLMAQTRDSIPDCLEIFTVVDEMPEYPGGESELQKYIATNFKSSGVNKLEAIRSRFVVRFAVMPDGRIDLIHTLKANSFLDEEGMRVIKSLPRWKPGRLKGMPVAVWYSLSVSIWFSE